MMQSASSILSQSGCMQALAKLPGACNAPVKVLVATDAAEAAEAAEATDACIVKKRKKAVEVLLITQAAFELISLQTNIILKRYNLHCDTKNYDVAVMSEQLVIVDASMQIVKIIGIAYATQAEIVISLLKRESTCESSLAFQEAIRRSVATTVGQYEFNFTNYSRMMLNSDVKINTRRLSKMLMNHAVNVIDQIMSCSCNLHSTMLALHNFISVLAETKCVEIDADESTMDP